MEKILSRRLLIPNSIVSTLPTIVKNELLESSFSKQEIFMKLYQEKSASLILTYLFLVPALFSSHYGYLQNWSRQILFWVTGGGLLVWWLIDLIRLPAIVKAHNDKVAFEIWQEVSQIGEGPVEGLF